MAMTREDWYRRYYKPLPANVRLVHIDHREDDLAKLWLKVMDIHALGQMLMHDVVAKQKDHGVRMPFNGKPEWFRRAVDKGFIPRPTKPFPPPEALGQALVLYNFHTKANFVKWSERARSISMGSYIDYLKRHAPIDEGGKWTDAISRLPITDAYTRESLLAR